MRSWFKWGLPLASVVLLGAAGGGVLLAENVYPRTLSQLPVVIFVRPLGLDLDNQRFTIWIKLISHE